MKKFNVGIQLYGVRNSMEKDFEGTLRALKDMGYEYVEFAGYYGKTSEEIKALLDDIGLKCVSVHQSLNFFDENPEAGMAYLKGFGVKYVVVPWYEQEALHNPEKLKDAINYFGKYADLFAKNGLMLGYHNHDFEFDVVDGKYIHDHIFDNIPQDKIIPELDTCWVRYAGLNPVEKIQQFKGRVPVVHLKDFTAKTFGGGAVYDLISVSGDTEKKATKEENEFKFKPLGMGVQDFASILKACEECGTETVIVEQDQTYEMGDLEAAKIARDYLKNTFGI